MLWTLSLINPQNPYSFIALGFYIFQTQIILALWSLLNFPFQAFRNDKSEEVEKRRRQAAVKDS